MQEYFGRSCLPRGKTCPYNFRLSTNVWHYSLIKSVLLLWGKSRIEARQLCRILIHVKLKLGLYLHLLIGKELSGVTPLWKRHTAILSYFLESVLGTGTFEMCQKDLMILSCQHFRNIQQTLNQLHLYLRPKLYYLQPTILCNRTYISITRFCNENRICTQVCPYMAKFLLFFWYLIIVNRELNTRANWKAPARMKGWYHHCNFSTKSLLKLRSTLLQVVEPFQMIQFVESLKIRQQHTRLNIISLSAEIFPYWVIIVSAQIFPKLRQNLMQTQKTRKIHCK